ncbi:hypothetical protein ATCC90586_008045 [Pythium insidiosum]|nr:hypothetical protein ATCC90586_008045 [Pythium insidiosum]
MFTHFQSFTLAAHKPGLEVEPFEYVARPLGPNTIGGGWGGANYPVVPGNEASVKDLQVGDRVGVGAMGVGEGPAGDVRELRDCPKMVFTYNATYEDGKTAYGGYAEYVRVDANYAFKIPEALFKIPEALPSDVAAPLLCAGVPVTFSQSPNKEEQARALGAEDFVVMLDPDAVKRAARSVHALIVTADAPNQHFVAR